MVCDGPTVNRNRLGFDRPDAPRRADSTWHRWLPPKVLAYFGNIKGVGDNDNVGLSEPLGQSEFGGIGPLDGRGHVSGVALGLIGVHPRRDRRDVFLTHPRIVLEILDSRVGVVLIRRHLPLHDHILDPPRIPPRILISHERHRSDGALLVADLTVFLEDRSDVCGERQLGIG